MQIGIFTINIDAISAFFNQSTGGIIANLFVMFGYLFIVWVCLYLGLMFYQEYRENKNTKDWKWVVLAIDVPPMNIQTPKGAEHLFSHLAGALDTPNIAAAFRGGYKQRWFSFEVISIEGYIQFLIRTEESLKDLVESAVYAQYPESEITEVEDYVNDIPATYPNDTHDIWASDFGTAQDDAFPIRMHTEFEHQASKDEPIKDPMSAFLESFSRIGSGEQMWFQILIEPITNDWKEKAIKQIKEMIGDKSGSASGNKYVDAALDVPVKFLENIGDQVFLREASEKKEVEPERSKLGELTPGQRKLLETMELKIMSIGFKTKMRGVYAARKEVFRPSRGVNALIGSMQQYNVPTSNQIVPTYGTGASYFFKDMRIKARKNLLMSAYKKRKIKAGSTPFVLNIAELATIWHFPMSYVKTPMVQKVEAKQSEPPVALPIERVDQLPAYNSDVQKPSEEPSEEDVKTDAFGYDDDMTFG